VANRSRQYNGSGVAAGDAHRVWFPEMIERLRSQWRPGLSFDAVVKLRSDLDSMLQRIRSERQIRSPVLRCPRCGNVAEGANPHLSVRAMILSLTRFGDVPAEHAGELERAWAVYRRQTGLDLYGNKTEVPDAQIAACAHPPAW
jgi:hypothetical protein